MCNFRPMKWVIGWVVGAFHTRFVDKICPCVRVDRYVDLRGKTHVLYGSRGNSNKGTLQINLTARFGSKDLLKMNLIESACRCLSDPNSSKTPPGRKFTRPTQSSHLHDRPHIRVKVSQSNDIPVVFCLSRQRRIVITYTYPYFVREPGSLVCVPGSSNIIWYTWSSS